MRQRTLAVLAALAVLTTVWLLLDSGPGPARGPELVFAAPAAITRIGLAVRGQPAVEIASEAGQVLVLPARVAADPTVFAAMSNAAQLLTVGRRLGAARPEYGLSPPRAQITLAGQTVALGADTPDGQGSYAEDRGRIFVVDRELAAAFLAPVLEQRVFIIPASGPVTLRISAAGAVLVLERTGDRRAFVTPPAQPRRRADYQAASDLLDRLGQLRLAPAGAGTGPTPDATAAAASAELELDLGGVTVTTAGPCPGHPGISAARVARPGSPTQATCLTVAPEALAELGDPGLGQRLTALSIFDMPPDDVAEARIAAAGRTLILRRSGGGFHLLPGDGGAATDADSDSVASWLEQLTQIRGRALAPLDRQFTPTVSITLTTASGLGQRAQRDGDRVRRADSGASGLIDEALTLVINPDPASWVAEPLRFRDREIVSFNATDLARVELSNPDQVAVRDADNAEAYHALGGHPLDPAAVLALRDTLANLRALRWVAPAAAPSHGLARPRRRVDCQLAEPGGIRKLGLELGADTPEGCYARRTDPPDPAVFLLDPARCRVLMASLAAP